MLLLLFIMLHLSLFFYRLYLCIYFLISLGQALFFLHLYNNLHELRFLVSMI